MNFAGYRLLDSSLNKPLIPTCTPCNESLDNPGTARMLRSRDPRAFDQMVEQHAPAVNRLVVSLLGFSCQHSADDLVQEVFVRAWKKIHTWRGDAKLATWLHSIAVNVCRNHHRKQRVKNALLGKVLMWQTLEAASSEEASLATRDLVRTAISNLNQADREVIVLRCMEERPTEEAAKLLGISAGTVDVRLHRARQRLKKILEQMDGS